MSPPSFAMNGCVETNEKKPGNPKVLQIFQGFFWPTHNLQRIHLPAWQRSFIEFSTSLWFF